MAGILADIQQVLGPWLLLVVALAGAVVGAVVGGLVTRKFGDRWLAMLAWLVDRDDVATVARIAWDAPGFIPANVKRYGFGNNQDRFVEWVLKKVDGLGFWTDVVEGQTRKMRLMRVVVR